MKGIEQSNDVGIEHLSEVVAIGFARIGADADTGIADHEIRGPHVVEKIRRHLDHSCRITDIRNIPSMAGP